MQKITPEKLKVGDEIIVIAPSRSASLLSKENNNLACEHFKKEFGLSVTFGEHIQEKDMFASSSIESRVSDIHNAFSDKNIKMISTVIGGFNSNQLLKYLDWNLIKKNPKILCGYSDVTVLVNAIHAKTGMITYLGPHFSTFAQKKYTGYTNEYFKKCLFESSEFSLEPSKEWLDDRWYMDQNNRTPIKNEGYWVLKTGEAEGTVVGGSISSFMLLFGTEYMPELNNSIVLLEADNYTQGVDLLEFDRQLQSLLQQKGSEGIRGIIIGRFQKESEVTREKLQYVIDTKKELKNIPIIANVDFGHTNPMITFPIGGICKINLKKDSDFEIKVLEH